MKLTKIKAIKKISEKYKRYDIQTEKSNNFFANDLLVHNSLIQVAWYNVEHLQTIIDENTPGYHDHELVVTSSGSFDSWHSNRAEQLLAHLCRNIDFDKTYIFELIGPQNQIVVKYPEEKLILLAVRETATGIELPLELFADKFEVVEPLGYKNDLPISFLAEEIARQEYLNEEGFIVKYSNGQRIKFKYHQYVQLHKIMTGISEKWVWETLKDGSELLLDSVPDEVYDWVKEVQAKLKAEFELIQSKIGWFSYEIQSNLGGPLMADFSRKDYAVTITNPRSPYFPYKHILFAMYDGKPYEYMIWDLIKPEGETRKFAANAAAYGNAKNADEEKA